MLQVSNPARSNHRNRHGGSCGLQEFQVISALGSIPVHAGEQDFSRTALCASFGPLDRVNACRSTAAMRENFPLLVTRFPRVDRQYKHLRTPRLRHLLDDAGIPHDSAIDANLVGTRIQERSHVIRGPNSSAHGKWSKHDVRCSLDDIQEGPSLFVGSSDVEKSDLVGAICVIPLGAFDRISRITDVDEVDAFDHSSSADVETRDDALGEQWNSKNRGKVTRCAPEGTAVDRYGNLCRRDKLLQSGGDVVKTRKRGADVWSFGQMALSWVIQPMAVCLQCGKDNPPPAAVCAECGTHLPAAKKANLAGTMVGMPSPVAQGLPFGAPPEKAAGPEDTKPAPAAPANRKGLAGTMIGMPSPLAKAAELIPAPDEPPHKAADGARGKSAALSQTMVGMGLPSALVPPTDLAQLTPQESAGQEPPMQPTRKFQGTLLGVAQPGIAPAPGSAPLPPAPPRAAELFPENTSPLNDPAEDRLSSEHVENPLPITRPIWKTIMLIVGCMAAAAAVGGAFALASPKPVTVVVEEFAIDVEGNDQLKLKCEECPEGSELILADAKVRVEDKRAVLTPRKPLDLGRNELKFTLQINGELREVKKVILPIAFRALTNWTGLHANPPHAEISVAAPSGSTVSIGGDEVALVDQKATRRVDFATETLGESAKVTRIESDYDIIVAVDGKARKTKVELRSGVTPLTLTSPAPVHQLGGKPVAISGRTSAAAKLKIGEAEVEADDRGIFTYVLKSPEPGKLVIIASADKLLSRRVEIVLAESAPVPAGAVAKFSDVLPGASVDLRASIIESRTVGGTTQALVEVEKGCDAPPCLLRAVYGEPKKLTKNRVVRFTGTVAEGTPLAVKVSRFY